MTKTTRILSRLALGGLALAFACDSAPPTSNTSTRPKATPSASKPVAPDQEPPEDRDDCDFKFKGQCYATEDAACLAAGCPDDCTIQETFPGRPVCDKSPVDPAAAAENAKAPLSTSIETMLTSAPMARGVFARAIVERQEVFHLLRIERLSPGQEDGDPVTVIEQRSFDEIHGHGVYRTEDLDWKAGTLYFKLVPAKGEALTCSVEITDQAIEAPRCAGIATE